MDETADTASPGGGRVGGGPADGVFTRYVRGLAAGREPTRESFLEMWRWLERALVRELRRRSLWTAPPSYLGVFGWQSWQAREPGPGRTTRPIEELLVDCYSLIFLRRLPRLQVRIAAGSGVDGLVLRYLRNFVHDRQRAHDRLGYRLFEVVRDAVAAAAGAGEIFLLGKSDKIRNATVLALTPREDPATRATPETLGPIVVAWNDRLLPELVTAGGAGRPVVVSRLRRLLMDLPAAGVRAFRFRDLLDPLKADVRQRWGALFDQQEGEAVVAEDTAGVQVVRVFRPSTRLEELESYARLTGCVSELLATIEDSDKNRHRLTTLWNFLRSYSSGEGPETMPSNRKLCILLGIPRHAFPKLYATLGQQIETCRDMLSGHQREAPSEINTP